MKTLGATRRTEGEGHLTQTPPSGVFIQRDRMGEFYPDIEDGLAVHRDGRLCCVVEECMADSPSTMIR